jgi:hypothetical protein
MREARFHVVVIESKEYGPPGHKKARCCQRAEQLCLLDISSIAATRRIDKSAAGPRPRNSDSPRSLIREARALATRAAGTSVPTVP